MATKKDWKYWNNRRKRAERWSQSVVVSPTVAKQYENKPLEDYYWMKGMSGRELTQEVQAAGIRFPDPVGTYTKPFNHQMVCALIGAAEPRFLFYLDPAAGKTLLSLTLIRYYAETQGALPVAILIPSPSGADVWMEQAALYTPELSVVDLTRGSMEDRWERAQGEGDLFIINYDGLVAMVAGLEEIGKNKKKRVLNRSAARILAGLFKGAVFDEVHHVGASTSPIVFSACCAISSLLVFCYGLTGTPHGRDPGKMFQQFRVVDKGETFGETVGLFNYTFYQTKVSRWGYLEREFLEDKKPLLAKMIRNRAIRYEDHEYSDLPPLVHVKIPVRLSPEARKAYNDMRMKDWVEAKDEERRTNTFSKGRQLASGFLYLEKVQGVPGRAFTRVGAINARTEALRQLLEEFPEDAKVIIFHEFVASGDMIEETLHSMKIPYVRLGKVKEASKSFREDKKVRVMVAQCLEGEVHDWKQAGYMVFYESTTRPDVRIQCEARARRPGNNQRVRVYDLVPMGTVEEKVLKYVKEGKDLLKEILSGREGL